MKKQAEKISVTMTTEQIETIRASVEAGEYASTSEALRDAVRVWQRQRSEDAERMASIKARIRRAISDPRPSLTEAEVDERLDRLFAAASDAGS